MAQTLASIKQNLDLKFSKMGGAQNPCQQLQLPTTKKAKSRKVSSGNLKWFYCVGLMLAFLLYGTLDINIHTSPSVVSSGPTLVVEVNLRSPSSLQRLDLVSLVSDKYNYTDGELDEESIASDPLTELLFDSENASANQLELSEPDPVLDATQGISDENGLENEQEENLTELEMKQQEVQRIIDNYRGPIRVALYTGAGTTTNAKNNIPAVLDKCSNGTIKVQSFTDASLSNIGRLRHDVLFIPGGSAGRIYTEMAKHAKKKHRLQPQFKIRKFLERGGGYVGICAGAYLAAGGKSGKSPLKISMFKTESGMLGDGYISGTWMDKDFSISERLVNMTAKGLSNQALVQSQLFYANGPIFKNETFLNEDFPQMRHPQVVLRMARDAYIRIFFGKKTSKTTHRRHQGLPLVVMNEFGKGRVVLSTAHPETNVHDVTYNTWKKAHEPSTCASQEAQTLMTMIYLAAGRGMDEIEL